MKKGAIYVIILLIVPLVCSVASGKQEKGPVTLTLWYPAGAITSTSIMFRDGSDPWQAFEAENNCKIDLVATDYTTMQQKLLTALAGGQAPDISMMPLSWMGAFVKEEALVPIPAANAKEFLKGVSPDTASIADWGGGKMYGYPSWGLDAYALTWNVVMFKEAGLDPNRAPTYLDEFREYSKKTCVIEGGEMKRVGYAIRHTGGPQGVVDKFDWLLEGAGIQFVDPPTSITGGKSIVDIPLAREALQAVHDMIYVDKSTSLNFPDPRDCLLKFIASMQISEVISIQVRQPKESPELKWAFAPPPAIKKGGKPVVHTNAWNYVVLSPTGHKDLALKAIHWFNNKQNDYEIAKRYSSTPRWKENYEKEPFASDSYVRQFKALLPYGRPYPKHLAGPAIMEGIGISVQMILHDEMGVAGALADAQKKADAAIAALE